VPPLSPAVAVPEQQAHVVDDGGLAQLDLEARAAVLLDGVPGEAVVQVVVLRVPVQQRRLQLPLHHLGAVLHGGDVLLRDWNRHTTSSYNTGQHNTIQYKTHYKATPQFKTMVFNSLCF